MTHLSTHQIDGAPTCWTNQLWVTNDGDYIVCTFKYQSFKYDEPCYLSPSGDYPID